MKKLLAFALFGALAATGAQAAQAQGTADDVAKENYKANAILQGNYTEAERDLQAALAENPEDVFALLNLAAVYQQTGQAEKAAELYDRVLKARENPYAMAANGRPTKAKSIAREGRARLE